jgi:hypothetical protein
LHSAFVRHLLSKSARRGFRLHQNTSNSPWYWTYSNVLHVVREQAAHKHIARDAKGCSPFYTLHAIENKQNKHKSADKKEQVDYITKTWRLNLGKRISWHLMTFIQAASAVRSMVSGKFLWQIASPPPLQVVETFETFAKLRSPHGIFVIFNHTKKYEKYLWMSWFSTSSNSSAFGPTCAQMIWPANKNGTETGSATPAKATMVLGCFGQIGVAKCGRAQEHYIDSMECFCHLVWSWNWIIHINILYT